MEVEAGGDVGLVFVEGGDTVVPRWFLRDGEGLDVFSAPDGARFPVDDDSQFGDGVQPEDEGDVHVLKHKGAQCGGSCADLDAEVDFAHQGNWGAVETLS